MNNVVHGPWCLTRTRDTSNTALAIWLLREANGMPHPPRASVTILPTVGRLAVTTQPGAGAGGGPG